MEVLWAEEAVAALWAVSAAARAEFPEHTPLVRRAWLCRFEVQNGRPTNACDVGNKINPC